MASSYVAAAFARRNIHYGWVVTAVTFVTLLVTAAAMSTPGVMIVPLEQEFGWSTNGLVQTHFVALCADYGLAATAAASVLAMMGAFDFIGTIGSGWLSDRFDNRWLLFWYYGLRGLSLLYLPFTDFSFYGLSLFAVFYGLDWIATVPPTVKLTADRFGRERAGMVFGWIFTGHQLGAATAALTAGVVRTAWSTYLPAFFVAGALCVIAALLILVVPKPSARALAGATPLPARG
jgi:MFS family permease